MKRTQKTTFITIIIAVLALVLVVGAFSILSNYQQNVASKPITQIDTIEMTTPAKAILDAENYPYVFLNDLFPDISDFVGRPIGELREELIPPAQAAIQMAIIAEKVLDKNLINLTTLVWLEHTGEYGVDADRLCWYGVVGYDAALTSEADVNAVVRGDYSTTRAMVQIDAITGAVLSVQNRDDYPDLPGEMRADESVVHNGRILYTSKDTAAASLRKEEVQKLTEQRIALMGLTGSLKKVRVTYVHYYMAMSLCEMEDGTRWDFDFVSVGDPERYVTNSARLQSKESLAERFAEEQAYFDQYGPRLYYASSADVYTAEQQIESDILWGECYEAQAALGAATDANRAALQQNLDQAIAKIKAWSLANIPREYWPDGIQYP